MKHVFLPLAALLLVTSPLLADEASHRAAAVEILKLNKAEELMKQTFLSIVEPAIQGLAAQGVPPEAINEINAAMLSWYEETMKWELIEPKFAELYVKEFTEDELKQLVEFYKTPVGEKVLTKVPTIMQEGSKVGESLAQANQASLDTKIQGILTKYQGGAGGPPDAAPAPEMAAPPAPETAAPAVPME